jgi:hypothetical protein
MACQVHGDELLVEHTPFIRQFVAQVLRDPEIGSDEIPLKALPGEDTLLAQHNAVIVLLMRCVLPLNNGHSMRCKDPGCGSALFPRHTLRVHMHVIALSPR